jgi:hypothetical protein
MLETGRQELPDDRVAGLLDGFRRSLFNNCPLTKNSNPCRNGKGAMKVVGHHQDCDGSRLI